MSTKIKTKREKFHVQREVLNMELFIVRGVNNILFRTTKVEVLFLAIKEDGDFLEDNTWVERANGECMFLSLSDWEGNIIDFHSTRYGWIIN